jgi:hypothetical protein
VTPAECDDNGGAFQGGGVSCQAAQCPIPDPCDGEHGDVLYNNSTPNGVNGLSSEDGSEFGWIESYSADDFTLSGDATIGGLHYYDLHLDNAVNGTGDYQILGDNGNCLPDDGNLIADVNDVEVLSLWTGNTLFGYKVWQNNFDNVNLPLSANHYWVAARLNLSGTTRSFWATASQLDCEGAFKSDFFGYTNWTPTSQVIGATDFAYCLTGPADPCSGVERGDSNGDGDIDFDDIDCFVGALISQETWADCGTELPPGAFTCANDINQDGDVDFDDIDGFVECLINGTCD